MLDATVVRTHFTVHGIIRCWLADQTGHGYPPFDPYKKGKSGIFSLSGSFQDKHGLISFLTICTINNNPAIIFDSFFCEPAWQLIQSFHAK